MSGYRFVLPGCGISTHSLVMTVIDRATGALSSKKHTYWHARRYVNEQVLHGERNTGQAAPLTPTQRMFQPQEAVQPQRNQTILQRDTPAQKANYSYKWSHPTPHEADAHTAHVHQNAPSRAQSPGGRPPSTCTHCIVCVLCILVVTHKAARLEHAFSRNEHTVCYTEKAPNAWHRRGKKRT